jgi:hypothetical protein
MTIVNLPRSEVQLSDHDGNAFVILGRVSRAMRKAGWTNEQIEVFLNEAKAGNYDHLLQTCMKYAEVT